MSLRRQTRLRKEYLYRKSLEGKERQNYERKERIKAALRAGKALPTELRNEEAQLRAEIEADDARTAMSGAPSSALGAAAALDDEYAKATARDPKIAVTTSRDPSSRLKQFAKEVRLIFPGASRINRGGYKMDALVAAARKSDFTDIVIVHEHRGEPDAMTISHLPYGPTAFFQLANVVMRHDIEDVEPVSEAAPHLIFDNFTTTIGRRFESILKHLYPVPRDASKRVITFANSADYISFRHHVFERPADAHKKEDVTLRECGPRFEMRPYMIKLGTLDQEEADAEWVYRPYMNTASKRTTL